MLECILVHISTVSVQFSPFSVRFGKILIFMYIYWVNCKYILGWILVYLNTVLVQFCTFLKWFIIHHTWWSILMSSVLLFTCNERTDLLEDAFQFFYHPFYRLHWWQCQFRIDDRLEGHQSTYLSPCCHSWLFHCFSNFKFQNYCKTVIFELLMIFTWNYSSQD